MVDKIKTGNYLFKNINIMAIRLTEGQLKKIISESVKNALNEISAKYLKKAARRSDAKLKMNPFNKLKGKNWRAEKEDQIDYLRDLADDMRDDVWIPVDYDKEFEPRGDQKYYGPSEKERVIKLKNIRTGKTRTIDLNKYRFERGYDDKIRWVPKEKPVRGRIKDDFVYNTKSYNPDGSRRTYERNSTQPENDMFMRNYEIDGYNRHMPGTSDRDIERKFNSGLPRNLWDNLK